MAVTLSRATLDQFLWRRNIPQSAPVPAALPAAKAPAVSCLAEDLDMFRPQEVQRGSAGSRLVMPAHLQVTGNRGGLSTWLATRKAESDRRREGEDREEKGRWLAGRAVASSSTTTSRKGSEARREEVKRGLLRAWAGDNSESKVAEKMEIVKASYAGPLSIAPHAQMQIHCKRIETKETSIPQPGKDNIDAKKPTSVPASNVIMMPMARFEANMQAAAKRNLWLTIQMKEEKEVPTAPITGPPRAEVLRRSLLSAWGGAKDEMPEVRNEPNELAEATRAEVVRESLLGAWAGSAAPPAAQRVEVPNLDRNPSRADTLRVALLSSWRQEVPMVKKTPDTASLADQTMMMSLSEEPEQSWESMDGASSEASIVTLDTVTDNSEDFDDFSDMKLELCQWISQK